MKLVDKREELQRPQAWKLTMAWNYHYNCKISYASNPETHSSYFKRHVDVETESHFFSSMLRRFHWTGNDKERNASMVKHTILLVDLHFDECWVTLFHHFDSLWKNCCCDIQAYPQIRVYRWTSPCATIIDSILPIEAHLLVYHNQSKTCLLQTDWQSKVLSSMYLLLNCNDRTYQ